MKVKLLLVSPHKEKSEPHAVVLEIGRLAENRRIRTADGVCDLFRRTHGKLACTRPQREVELSGRAAFFTFLLCSVLGAFYIRSMAKEENVKI